MASAIFEEAVLVWDVQRLEKAFAIESKTSQGTYAHFTPDGSKIVAGGLHVGYKGYIQVWDVATRKLLAEQKQKFFPWAGLVTPNGETYIITDQTELQFWDLPK